MGSAYCVSGAIRASAMVATSHILHETLKYALLIRIPYTRRVCRRTGRCSADRAVRCGVVCGRPLVTAFVLFLLYVLFTLCTPHTHRCHVLIEFDDGAAVSCLVRIKINPFRRPAPGVKFERTPGFDLRGRRGRRGRPESSAAQPAKGSPSRPRWVGRCAAWT